MTVKVKEAVNIWIERAKGSKIRELGAKYDIDPRRIYEVFEGKKHPESLAIAQAELSKSAPHLVSGLQFHKPSLKVIRKLSGDGRQGSLF